MGSKLAGWTMLGVALAGCSSSSTTDATTPDTTADASVEAEPTYADPYEIVAFDKAHIGSDGSKPDFQNAKATIDLHDGPFASVKLVADLESPCYPFEKWKTDPPPSGQNWPADCDAFDRNWSYWIDEPKDPKADPPALEIVHAITPFGGPEHVEVDLTDLFNARPGSHELHTQITAYSDGAGKVSGSNGGWFVTTKLEVTPGPAPRKVLAAIPLVSRTVGPTDTPDVVPFTVPDGTVDARLEWKTSGHGGGDSTGDSACIGPAEEFCHRSQDLLVDGTKITTLDPWRKDCTKYCTLTAFPGSSTQKYCLEDPCGDPSSVRAPRANWCPGSMTAPFEVTSPALATPGQHTFTWKVSKILSGGVWDVSGIYFAYGDLPPSP